MNIIDIVNDLITKIPYVEMIPAANVVVPVVVAIVSIIFAHYGKRLLNVLKFVVCAGAGYWFGSTTLWGFVGGFLQPHGITNVVVGVVIALICALLCKFAYALVFAGLLGYAAYALIPVANPVHAIVLALIVGVIALIFRGFLETIITSVGGGVGFSVGLYTAIVAITDILNFGANGTGIKLEGNTPVLGTLTFEIVVIVVIAVLVCFCGFIKQVKNRHRY